MTDIHVTDRAKTELIDKLKVNNDERFLRVGVTQGGCSGMTFTACIDTEKKDVDEVVFQEAPILVITDKDSAQYLNGLTIDYSDDLIKSGFQFSNKNASKSCGCGASFAV